MSVVRPADVKDRPISLKRSVAPPLLAVRLAAVLTASTVNAGPTVCDPGAYLNDLKAMGISSPGCDEALLGFGQVCHKVVPARSPSTWRPRWRHLLFIPTEMRGSAAMLVAPPSDDMRCAPYRVEHRLTLLLNVALDDHQRRALRQRGFRR